MKPKNEWSYPQLKQRLFELCWKHKLHHLGSYFSSLEMIDTIYNEMKDDDVFILSAGHAVGALYVVLEKYLGISADELVQSVGEHPKLSDKYQIHCSTGSLGMGITVAVGRAMANPNRHVYCLVSDGECAEGCVWESLQFIHERKLTNITVFINANGFCAYDTVDVDYLEQRVNSFCPNNAKVIRTTVEHYPFLKGIHAHYKTITEAEYEQYKGELL